MVLEGERTELAEDVLVEGFACPCFVRAVVVVWGDGGAVVELELGDAHGL